jgi:hypothetical protein
MKIADLCIHQPSYWPWLGLLDKIAKTKEFILLDDVQVSKGTYQYRNQFYCNGKAKILTIPTKIHLGYTFCDLQFLDGANIIDHLYILDQYYKHAPYSKEIIELIAPIYNQHFESPLSLLIATIQKSMELLGINTPMYLSSSYKEQGRKGDLVLALCIAHGANSYLAGSGSYEYMQDYLYKFQSAGITVLWHNFTHPNYPQLPDHKFISGLSCLDLLFFMGVPKARELFWNNVNR